MAAPYKVIPEVRKEMQQVIDGPDLEPPQYRALLINWLPRLERRKSVRRANTGTPRTPKEMQLLKAKALRLAADYPNLSYQEIAYAIGVRNIGRVSEWMAGFPPRATK
jgi:hypothetical protein